MKFAISALITTTFLLIPQLTHAGDESCPAGQACYPARSYSTYSCQQCNIIWRCLDPKTGTLGARCETTPCGAYSECRRVCDTPSGTGTCTLNPNLLAECNTSPGHCEVSFQTQNCLWEGNSCTQPFEYLSWGCCGTSSATPTPVPAPTPTPSNQPIPTCTLSSISGSANLSLGTSAIYSVTAAPTSGTVDRIEFTVSQTNTVLTPATLVTDTSSPYTSTYTASGLGTATIIAKCIMGGQIKDSQQLTVTITAPTTTVTANIYDQTAQAGCTSTTLAPFIPTTRLTDSSNNTTSMTTNPATFTNVISTPGTQSILSVINTPSDWLPTPGCGGSSLAINFTAANYNTPITRNFYFTRQAEAWWQVAGGDVYASNSNINTIPSSATNQYTMTNLANANSSGVLIAGNTNSINVAGPTGRQWLVNNSTAQSQQKYAYFKTLLEVSNPLESFTTNPINSFNGATPAKTYTTGNTNQVYYHNGNLTITSLNVTNGEKRTLLVENGNIAISGNITVQPGGFLAIITTGNIIFGGNVTNVQGIYIANGTLTINNANSSLTGLARQFVGQGVFVGWSGVVINRNLNLANDDLYNNTDPAAKFIYRPDFIINAPISFKHSSIKWAEVAPNSF